MQTQQLNITSVVRVPRTPLTVSQPPSVGILVSTYNWPEALQLIFKSIAQQTVLPNEILIANDGSDELTNKLIRKFSRSLNISIKHAWHNDDGFRKSIILNKAMRLAEADYIIQIDGDIILHPKFVEDHLKNAEKGKFVQGARTLVTKEKTEKLLRTRQCKLRFYSAGLQHRFNSLRLPLLSPLLRADPYSSGNIKGCNLAFWRSDFIAVNGYNNSFCGWGWEDNEFAARLINAGILKKRLKLAAICYHLHHDCNKEAVMNEVKYNETIESKKPFCTDGYVQV